MKQGQGFQKRRIRVRGEASSHFLPVDSWRHVDLPPCWLDSTGFPPRCWGEIHVVGWFRRDDFSETCTAETRCILWDTQVSFSLAWETRKHHVKFAEVFHLSIRACSSVLLVIAALEAEAKRKSSSKRKWKRESKQPRGVTGSTGSTIAYPPEERETGGALDRRQARFFCKSKHVANEVRQNAKLQNLKMHNNRLQPSQNLFLVCLTPSCTPNNLLAAWSTSPRQHHRHTVSKNNKNGCNKSKY